MTIFDLLFLLGFFITVITWIVVGWRALRGRKSEAWSLLRRWAIIAAIYMAIVIVVAIIKPRRILEMSEDLCFDDWCIAVNGARPLGAGRYDVELRVSSRARGRPQREYGIVVELVDGAGNHYRPQVRPDDEPLSVLLQPGDRAIAHRLFQVPESSRDLAVEISHGNALQPGWFVIGDGPPILQKQPIVRLGH